MDIIKIVNLPDLLKIKYRAKVSYGHMAFKVSHGIGDLPKISYERIDF